MRWLKQVLATLQPLQFKQNNTTSLSVEHRCRWHTLSTPHHEQHNICTSFTSVPLEQQPQTLTQCAYKVSLLIIEPDHSPGEPAQKQQPSAENTGMTHYQPWYGMCTL
jgi:hypothetical protein